MFDPLLALTQTSAALAVIVIAIALCERARPLVPAKIWLPRLCAADVTSPLVSFCYYGLPGVDRVALYKWVVRRVFGSAHATALYSTSAISWGINLAGVALFSVAYALRARGHIRWIDVFRTGDRQDFPWDNDDFRRLRFSAAAYALAINIGSTAAFICGQTARLGSVPLPDNDPRIANTNPATLSGSVLVNLAQTAAYMLAADFLAYCAHRAMHAHPRLYWFHKRHHEFHEVSALAAVYLGPVDLLLVLILPARLGMLVAMPHTATIWLIQINSLVRLFFEHAGYSPDNHRYGRALSVPPWARGAAHHDLHHREFTVNYGARWAVWDRMFGTFKRAATD